VSLTNWQQAEITDLRGEWSRLDQKEARPNRGFVAHNVRFEPGRVRSRDAFIETAVTVPGKATSFHNWIGHGLNRLIYASGGAQVRMRNVATGADTLLFSATCRGITLAEAGDKAIIASFTSAGDGAAQARISLPLVGAGEIDKAFSAPWTNTFTCSDFGTGNASQGTKRFGYIIETRTGFTGKPAPVSGGVFVPVSFTVAAGGRTVKGTMTVNIPAEAGYLHPITTRTDNPDKWYFEPGMSVLLPSGASGYSLSWYYTASDESLEASAVEVVDNFDLLTQDGSGNGPFSPHCAVSYGKRAVYLTPHRAYISEPGDYQYVTDALHGLELPGKRQLVTGFPFRQSLYLLGPGWTYEVSDNGDYPSTWTNPTEISSAIGTPAIKGVCWQTAGDYVWVAAVSGLYLFNGSYSRIPVSHMNSDWWGRINWAAAQSLVMVDDYVHQRIIVAVPLDAATEPSHMFVWDYARGVGPADVDFSWYDSASVTFSALALVMNNITGTQELWLGPTAAGAVHKEYAGTTCEAASQYETGFTLTGRRKKESFIGAVDLDVSGEGDLSVIVYSTDREQYTEAGPLTLAAYPGYSPQLRFNIQSENASVRLTAAAGGKFDFSGLTVYLRPWVGNR
jgi:hypothetical protein